MMRIGIDAGHGGSNHGTEDEGFIEKTVTLAVSENLAELVGAMGHVPIMTRTFDKTVQPEERAGITNANRCDLVLVPHCNDFTDPETSGVMAFYYPGNQIGRAVAGAIVASSPYGMSHGKPLWPANADDWTRRARNVIKLHNATAICVELGFRTNELDRARLLNHQTQWALAVTMAAGVARFAEMKAAGS